MTKKTQLTNEDLSFYNELNKTKQWYPFKNWRANFIEFQMIEYTEENCNAAKHIFDNLINDLIKLGKNSKEKDKITLFKKAVISLN